MNPTGDDSWSATVRRRVLFRCWHRGTQESDLLLGSFADACLGKLDEGQIDQLESLLDCSDPDLFDWILGASPPPREHDHEVLCLLRSHWAQYPGRSSRGTDLERQSRSDHP